MTSPTAYFYGHLSPSENAKLYKLLISNLARDINKKFEKNEKGTFVHRFSLNDSSQNIGDGYKYLRLGGCIRL